MSLRLVHDSLRPLHECVARATDAFLRERALVRDEETAEVRRDLEAARETLARAIASLARAPGECELDEPTRALVTEVERAYRMWKLGIALEEEAPSAAEDLEGWNGVEPFSEALADLCHVVGLPRRASDLDAREVGAPVRARRNENVPARARELLRLVDLLGPEPWRNPSFESIGASRQLVAIGRALRESIGPEAPLRLELRRMVRACLALDRPAVAEVALRWEELRAAARALSTVLEG